MKILCLALNDLKWMLLDIVYVMYLHYVLHIAYSIWSMI